MRSSMRTWGSSSPSRCFSIGVARAPSRSTTYPAWTACPWAAHLPTCRLARSSRSTAATSLPWRPWARSCRMERKAAGAIRTARSAAALAPARSRQQDSSTLPLQHRHHALIIADRTPEVLQLLRFLHWRANVFDFIRAGVPEGLPDDFRLAVIGDETEIG